MTREQDAQAVVEAIEDTPAALELRARVAAAIRNRGRSDLDAVEQEALRLCADAAWMVLDAHPEIARFLEPPPAASLGAYLLRTAAAGRIAAWVVEMDLRDRSREQ
jgi:hypothetical protein